MRTCMVLLCAALLLAGCGSSGASSPTSTAGPRPTSAGNATPGPVTSIPQPTTPPTVVVSADYKGFLTMVCRALAARDSATVINSLPYYQYNSGLRYGRLGDGEGQTADPSLMRTWLDTSRVTCTAFTPGVAGHGTILAKGWTQPGGWAILEIDTFNGHWKINDFTFGDQASLYNAMRTSSPILAYRG